MNILPDVNASASRNYNFGHQVDPFTNEFINDNTVTDNYGVYSNLNLFTGLVNLNAIKANKYNTEPSKFILDLLNEMKDKT